MGLGLFGVTPRARSCAGWSLGRSSSDAATPAESVYEYSPANGGSSANPVYLRIVREDPEGCAPVGLTLTLQ